MGGRVRRRARGLVAVAALTTGVLAVASVAANNDIAGPPWTDGAPPLPPWVTLYISGGKKDKLSKMDIVGFLSKKGGLRQDELGKIELMDFMSFVAVKKDVVGRLLKAVQAEKMKGKKYKIVVAQ